MHLRRQRVALQGKASVSPPKGHLVQVLSGFRDLVDKSGQATCLGQRI